jgi:hypothetical protein
MHVSFSLYEEEKKNSSSKEELISPAANESFGKMSGTY